MPTPKKGEKQSKFMSRCVSDVMGEGKDQKQAVAICFSLWKEKSEELAEDFVRIPVKIVRKKQTKRGED